VIYPIIQYLKYYSKARNNLRLHSPFVFEFYNEVLLRKSNDTIEVVEKITHYYSINNIEIPIEDYGAGSKTSKQNNSTKKHLRNVASKKKYGLVLHKLVKFLNAENILELGTNLGVGTAYLASVNCHQKIISIEGNKAMAEITRKTLTSHGLERIQIIADTFENTLPEVLQKNTPFHLIFIDGNHTKNATLNYFHQILPFVNEQTVIVFDDIYWSKEMTEAWNEIKEHSMVKLSIDIYKFGIVFFRKEQYNKEHFTLWY
jgi:predicted O-methyltransferase YrrM